MSSDPVSSLIESLKALQGASQPSPGEHLAQAGELVPSRTPTQVPQVSRSQLLEQFRRQRQEGLIELAVVEGLFELIRALLVRGGVLV